jgi:hypothetical protein
MKFLAAALVLFIGATGDLALASATSNASAARPVPSIAAAPVHHGDTSRTVMHPDPFVWSH